MEIYNAVLQQDSLDLNADESELREFGDAITRHQGKPNSKPFVASLTHLNKVSSHKGKKQRLNPAGADLTSLVGKPVHFTKDFSAHKGKEDYLTAGVTLGAKIDEDEHGQIIKVAGILYDADFPEEVEYVEKNKGELGMSYEISANVEDLDMIEENVIDINNYFFKGSAIIKKDKAAFKETAMLYASDEGEFDEMFEAKKLSFNERKKKVSNASANEADTKLENKITKKYILTKGGTHMIKLCEECQPVFLKAHEDGEFKFKQELEANEEIAKVNEKIEALEAERDKEKEDKEKLEKEFKDYKAEEEKKEEDNKAELQATQDWGNDSKFYKEDDKQKYIDAKKQIYLKADVEVVSEAYEWLMKNKQEPKKEEKKGLSFMAGVEKEEESTNNEFSEKARALMDEKRLKEFFLGESVES